MCINTPVMMPIQTNIVYNCKYFTIFDPMSETDRAIVEVFKSDLFNNMCKRYGGNNHEDLKGEVMLIICELPQEKKKQMIENNYLMPYALRVLRFQSAGDSRCARGNSFQRKFADPTMIYTGDTIDIPSTPGYGIDFINDILEPKVCSKVAEDGREQTNPYFYHSRLLMETIRYKSMKEAAKVIGIPYVSVQRNLKDYKKFLNEWLRSQQS